MNANFSNVPKESLPTPEERLEWFAEYDRVRSVPLVCKKFGISRKTFYKWLKIYKSHGNAVESLQNRSRRPHSNPRATPEHIIQRLKTLREQTGFGQKRLQLYLSIWYGIEIAENTIWKILKRSGVNMKETKNKRRTVKPNEPSFPGDRIVIFVKKFEHPIAGERYYYYDAVDECTHLRIGKLYYRHSTLSALDFVQFIIKAFPFPVRYIHTPLDNAFTSVALSRSKTHAFTQNLRKLGIKHHVPTRRQSNSERYRQWQKAFDAKEPFLHQSFDSVAEAEQGLHEFLFEYNNNHPRAEKQHLTPLQKLQEFEQFKNLQTFDPYHRIEK
jgi:transposase